MKTGLCYEHTHWANITFSHSVEASGLLAPNIHSEVERRKLSTLTAPSGNNREPPPPFYLFFLVLKVYRIHYPVVLHKLTKNILSMGGLDNYCRIGFHLGSGSQLPNYSNLFSYRVNISHKSKKSGQA